VNGEPVSGDVLRLDLTPGDHAVELAVRTDYGTLPGKQLRYRVAPD
jgi:hypothetical protein